MRSSWTRWVGAVALLLTACGSSGTSGEPAVVGTWVYDAVTATQHLKSSGMPDAEVGRFLGLFEKMGMEISFAQDHSVKFTVKQLGMSNESEGTWSISGDQVLVQPTKFGGETPGGAMGQSKAFLWRDGRLWLQTGQASRLPLKRKS